MTRASGRQQQPAQRSASAAGAVGRRSVASRPGDVLEREADSAFMEPRFGHDFSRIRIHTGAKAGSGPLPISRTPSKVVQRAGDPTKVPAGMPCAIGTTSPGSPVLDVRFEDGVGKLNGVEQARIRDFVTSRAALGGNSPVRVDGYASEPGGQELNWSLSCERAMNTVTELMKPTPGMTPGVSGPMPVAKSQISWFAHGETNEFSSTDQARNRVALISTPPPAPVQPQALLISTVSGPNALDCGGYSWMTSWLLNKNSDAGGHIVQHIVVDYDIRNLLGIDITARIVKPHWDFWEAWSVNAGEGAAGMIPATPTPTPSPTPTPVTPGTPPTKGGTSAPGFPVPYSAGSDTFGDSDTGWGTKGKIVVTGDARFYEGLVTLPAHFVHSNPDTQAQALPSTTTDPKLTGGTPNVDHDLAVEWDCRVAKSKTTIISHTP